MMIYSLQLFRLLFAVDDHIFRIGKAEEIKRPWNLIAVLSLVTVAIYVWMAMLGIGSASLSSGVALADPSAYELNKLWFSVGRAIYSLVFVAFILLVPSLLFYWVTKVPFKKLLLMQIVVLFVLLVERLLWIPLSVYADLAWYVSPLSFGIIASYVTDIPFLIYLLGSISLFQLWIIGFQLRFLTKLSSVHQAWVWSAVILFHLVVWTVTAVVTHTDVHLLNRWFE